MIKSLLAVLCTTLVASSLNAQSSPDKLDIVSWNIEWFGAPGQDPTDDALQEANVKKTLRYLNADLYGMVEVVDTSRFRKLVDSLGGNYGYVIAPYATNNTTGTGNGWLTAQKLAFIYNKNIFTNVKSRGLLRTSATANTNFATGRFPFMLSADVTINGITKTMNFILLHAKAGDTPTDYQRRRDGAKELKDTLDAHFSTSINFILGDFNDALNKTICSGCGTNISSYDVFVKDSTDSDSYKSVTLPLGVAGLSSMTNFPNVIDNHIISNELAPFYVPQSATIRTDVLAQVQNYDVTTSDHYPVYSQYSLSGVNTSIPAVTPAVLKIKTYPNPFAGAFQVSFEKTLQDVTLQLVDMQGRIYFDQSYKRVNAGTTVSPQLPTLNSGVYFLSIQTREYRSTIKLTRL